MPLALIQGYGQMLALNNFSNVKVFSNFGLFSGSTFFPTMTVLVSLTAGTIFAMWLGELITENGVGNGISLIIFAGIVARLPTLLGQQISAGNVVFLIVMAVIAIGVIFAVVFMSEGQRRIPVQYAKRIRGNRMYQGQSTHIPLRVNSAGMIPLIFAASIVILPGTVSTYFFAAQPDLAAKCGSLDLQQHLLDRVGVLAHLLHSGGGIHLLLHGGHIPATKLAGDPAKEWWIHSWAPARQDD